MVQPPYCFKMECQFFDLRLILGRNFSQISIQLNMSGIDESESFILHILILILIFFLHIQIMCGKKFSLIWRIHRKSLRASGKYAKSIHRGEYDELRLFAFYKIIYKSAEIILTYSESMQKVFKCIWRIRQRNPLIRQKT
jgi:hypothetical protein